MTRKDYILLAGAFNDLFSRSLDVHSSANPQAVITCAERVACALAQDNARFDRQHFLAVVRGAKKLQSRPSRKQVQS
jgi:hypothetical protein